MRTSFLLLFSILCCLPSCLSGQSTFNKRWDFDKPSLLFTNIECESDTCFLLGIITNPSNFSLLGTLFFKVDHDGQLLDSVFLLDDQYSLTGWEKNMRFLEDSSLMFVGSIQTELPYRPWLVNLNRDGTIIDSMILSDYAGNPNNYAVGNNWIFDSVYTYVFYSFYGNNNVPVAIEKFEQKILIQRKVIYPAQGSWLESVLRVKDKWIMGVRMSTEQPHPLPRIRQCGLYSIDKNMHVTQEWVSPPDSNYFAAYDLLEVDDDEYVVATLRYDKDENFGDPFVPWVIRVNTFTKEILWSIDLGLDIPNPPNASTKLLFNLDSTAIYITGQQFEIGILNERPPQVHGFLSKVSMDGELQWIRRYLGTEGSQFPDHKIFDAALLEDGSIIMVGESSDLFFEDPPGQRGWLLKVDSFGCLVPGCQLVSTEPYETDQALHARVYPNPVVSDQVWVYIADNRLSGRLQFSLYDMQGRQVQQWSQTYYQNSTYLLDIPPGLATGAYILSLEDDQGHFWQEKLVITR
jgi:hypothetical protein